MGGVAIGGPLAGEAHHWKPIAMSIHCSLGHTEYFNAHFMSLRLELTQVNVEGPPMATEGGTSPLTSTGCYLALFTGAILIEWNWSYIVSKRSWPRWSQRCHLHCSLDYTHQDVLTSRSVIHIGGVFRALWYTSKLVTIPATQIPMDSRSNISFQ